MPAFKYTAFDNRGKKKEGIINADSLSVAISSLKEKGLYPDSIEKISENRKNRVFGFLAKKFFRISQRERADVFFQLATLVNTSMPLTEALTIVAEQTSNKRLKAVLIEIRDKVSEGVKFSEALSNFESVFLKQYIKMIEIAEKTGKLPEILFKIAQREEEKSTFNQKIAPVILYPLFVMLFGTGVVIFLLGYVVPKMQKIFESFHKKLPFITRLLVNIGLFINNYMPIILVLTLTLLIVVNFAYFKIKFFRRKIDAFLLKIPIYRKIAVSQFVSNLSFQLDAFIPLVDAVISSSETIGNVIFKEKLLKAADKINEGVAVEKAFKEAGIFDKMLISSIATGRRSGRLPDFIRRIASYYEKKIDLSIKTTLSVLEPLTILILGTVVGFIVMAIMVPLFSINQLVR